MITTIVETRICFIVGQVTRPLVGWISRQTSWQNFQNSRTCSIAGVFLTPPGFQARNHAEDASRHPVLLHREIEEGRRDSTPQQPVLETGALAVRATALRDRSGR